MTSSERVAHGIESQIQTHLVQDVLHYGLAHRWWCHNVHCWIVNGIFVVIMGGGVTKRETVARQDEADPGRAAGAISRRAPCKGGCPISHFGR